MEVFPYESISWVFWLFFVVFFLKKRTAEQNLKSSVGSTAKKWMDGHKQEVVR